MATAETRNATGGLRRLRQIGRGGPGVHSGAILPQAPIDDKEAAGRLFAHLWRGGAWAYYWTPTGKESLWFPVGRAPSIPAAWLNQNCSFGVHPCGARYGKDERSKIATVTVVNCLFRSLTQRTFGQQNGDLGKAQGASHLPDRRWLTQAAGITAIGFCAIR